MASNIKRIAELLGARRIEQIPETGGGAFGAARLARIFSELQEPSQGKEQDQPIDRDSVHHRDVPMSEETFQKLVRLAEKASGPERSVSPMQVAAKLLEEALSECSDA